jgi:3-oxoacyl-[acyl-carrier protein] reductase
MYDLSGKTALVTGGSHGIGRQIVLDLLSEHCNVMFFGRQDSNVTETKQLAKPYIQLGASLNGFVLDIQGTSAIDALLDTLNNSTILPDILINNVGGGGRWNDAEWEVVFHKNVKTMIRLTTALVPKMTKNKYGRVITIGSVYGKEAGTEDSKFGFVMSKSAQIGFMKTMSRKREFARNGITFNTICPGYIYIPGTGWGKNYESPEEFDKHTVEYNPIGKFGTPEDVSNLVLFLCSEKASYINGTTITVDGGMSRSF